MKNPTRPAIACRLAIAITLASASPALAEVVITHDGVDCVVVGSFPVIRARLEPRAEVAQARVYFQARGTPHWYYVEMRSDAGTAFEGMLPRPLDSLDGFDYYIEALGPRLTQGRTRDYSARVITESRGCAPGLRTATAVGSVPSGLLVGAAEGAPALPPGFSHFGLVSRAGGAATSAAGAGAPSCGRDLHGRPGRPRRRRCRRNRGGGGQRRGRRDGGRGNTHRAVAGRHAHTHAYPHARARPHGSLGGTVHRSPERGAVLRDERSLAGPAAVHEQPDRDVPAHDPHRHPCPPGSVPREPRRRVHRPRQRHAQRQCHHAPAPDNGRPVIRPPRHGLGQSHGGNISPGLRGSGRELGARPPIDSLAFLALAFRRRRRDRPDPSLAAGDPLPAYDGGNPSRRRLERDRQRQGAAGCISMALRR